MSEPGGGGDGKGGGEKTITNLFEIALISLSLVQVFIQN